MPDQALRLLAEGRDQIPHTWLLEAAARYLERPFLAGREVIAMLFVLAIGWQRLTYLIKTSKQERLEADRWLLGQIEAQANGWEAYDCYLEGGSRLAA